MASLEDIIPSGGSAQSEAVFFILALMTLGIGVYFFTKFLGKDSEFRKDGASFQLLAMVIMMLLFWFVGIYILITNFTTIVSPDAIQKPFVDVFGGDVGENIPAFQRVVALLCIIIPMVILLYIMFTRTWQRRRHGELALHGVDVPKVFKGLDTVRKLMNFTILFLIVYGIGFLLIWYGFAFEPEVDFIYKAGDNLFVATWNWSRESGLAGYMIMVAVIATLLSWSLARVKTPYGMQIMVLGGVIALLFIGLLIKFPVTINGVDKEMALLDIFWFRSPEEMGRKLLAIVSGVILFFLSVNVVLAFFMGVTLGTMAIVFGDITSTGITNRILYGDKKFDMSLSVRDPAKVGKHKKRNLRKNRKRIR